MLASTKAVREAYVKEGQTGADNVKPFDPQLVIPMTQRVSQLVFSSDESSLLMAAEEGGGLAVYDVDAVMQGNTQMSFAIPTDNIGVRALIPNPTDGSIFALVLTDGKLMVVNLKNRGFITGANGPVLREGTSCVSWSTKGKQLVAGLADGTAVQMTPDGVVKAELPYPPQVRNDQPTEHHVSAISWLNNDTFLSIYTPSDAATSGIPESQFLIIQRQPKTTNFTFHRILDPCPPFGMERVPPHHFICRLKDFPPALNDALILASTGAGDIGVFTNASTPLASDDLAQQTANMYTFTALADDSRRAQLPALTATTDSSPLGMVLDLSSNEPVKRPIPADSDIDASSTPLPLLLALNNQGLLSAWWFVYSDSVRQKTAFPGLVAVAGQQQPSSQSPMALTGASAQSQASPFGAMQNSSAPAAAPGSAFGGASTFGAPAALGAATASPWGTQNSATASSAPAFGKPAFGAPAFGTPGGSAFGPRQSAWGTPSASSSGNKPNPFGAAAGASSPFGALASDKPQASPFGAMASSGSTASPFGAVASDKPASSPFAGLGSNTTATSPFGGLAGQSQKSIFGSTSQAPPLPSGPSFGSSMTTAPISGGETSFGTSALLGGKKSPWGAPTQSNNAIDQSAKASADDAMMDDDAPADVPSVPEQKKPETSKPPTNLFGMPSGGFSLSSPKVDEPTKDAALKPDGNNLFGSGFGAALDNAAAKLPTAPLIKAEPKEEVLLPAAPADDKPAEKAIEPAPESTAPAADAVVETTKSASSPNVKTVEAVSPVNAEPEDDPLPPDPVTNKKLYESVKDPLPIFGAKPAPAVQTAQEPPPDSPKPALPADDDDEASLAGSSPVDLGAPSSSEKDESSKGLAAEKPQIKPAPTSKLPVSTIRPGPAWSFPKADKSPEPPKLREGAAPETQRTPTSSLFGTAAQSFTPSTAAKPSDTPTAEATKPPFLFQRPDAAQDSPRSPSPVRAERSGIKSGSPTMRRISPMRSKSMQRPASPQRVAAPSINFEPPKEIPLPQVAAPPPQLRIASGPSGNGNSSAGAETPASPASSTSSLVEPTAQALAIQDDITDLEVANELAEPIQSTRKLAPFVAHQDYVSNLVFPPGVPTSIEKVYRDIQSMIDTLGLNSRALTAFTEWQQESYRDGGRARSDLTDEDDWCLIEVEDLGLLQRDLEKHLDAERLEAPREKIEHLTAMLRELARLRARHADIHRLVALHGSDTAEAERARKAQLTSEQTATLRDLRKDYAKVQSQLASAEDALTELSAKLTALSAGSGSNSAQGQPTVEAIVNTIAKMTRMAEARRNEVDVVEAQLRRAGFRPRSKAQARQEDAANAEDLGMSLGAMSLGSSQRRSVYGTPGSAKTPASPGRYKLEFSSDDDDTDDNFEDAAAERDERNARLSRSASKSSPGKALALRRGKGELPKPSEEALLEFQAKRARRKKVFGKLKERITARTPGSI